MAQLQLFGKILSLGNLVQIPTKTGGVYEKRELVLDCTRYNPNTGEPIENYPVLEFGGRHAAELNNWKAGDDVRVSFSVNGVRYTDKSTGEIKYFTKLEGYRVEAWVKGSAQQAQQVYTQQPAVSEQPSAQVTSPQAQQPFPPQVDANGNPKGDDLPF